MPEREEHLAKADSNGRFLSNVVSQQLAPDWAVTVLFYQAMHLIEAGFARDGIHHMSHAERNRAIFEDMSEITGPYRRLYDLSRIARYGADQLVTWSDYQDLTSDYEQIATHLTG